MKISLEDINFLVAEDNIYARRVLRGVLIALGARKIQEFEDGPTAFEAFLTKKYDVVILDWDMPMLDGVEVTRMLRQPTISPNPYVPIILVTGFTEKKRIEIARDAGVTEVVAKPFSTRTLYEKIVSVIAHPRPFVKTKNYFGPTRRRKLTETPVMSNRRRAAAVSAGARELRHHEQEST